MKIDPAPAGGTPRPDIPDLRSMLQDVVRRMQASGVSYRDMCSTACSAWDMAADRHATVDTRREGPTDGPATA